jgi:hypothetical protein
MLHAPLRGWALAALAAAVLASASAQEQNRTSHTSISSWPISPAVIATFIGHHGPLSITPGQEPPRTLPTDPVTLDLLVLWRGAPGWFIQGSRGHESGGGDSSGRVSVHVERGGVVLDLTLDTQKRVAQIGKKRVALGDANVVLVDAVDVPDGLTVVGTGTVDPRIEGLPTGVYDALRGVPDLVPFLRCEAKLPVPPAPKDIPSGAATGIVSFMQQVLDNNCARIAGK